MERWIVVDGLDGSGKSTVARWMEEHYLGKGDRVHVQIHPSDRRAGRIARWALQRKGGPMFILSTCFFILDVLVSLLLMRRWARIYDTVIFVRYVMAAAYLPKRVALRGYEVLVKVLPIPDRLLLVDVQPEVAMHRIASREEQEEMFENLPSLRREREKVLMLSSGWSILDNNGGETISRERLLAILSEWDRPPADG